MKRCSDNKSRTKVRIKKTALYAVLHSLINHNIYLKRKKILKDEVNP